MRLNNIILYQEDTWNISYKLQVINNLKPSRKLI